MKRGKFITIEGGEGVGKTSFLSEFSKRLHSKGIDLEITREPGGSPVAETIRDMFISPPEGETLTMEAEFLLVNAARAQHIANKILPALEQGRWVLCDRFKDSTRVYQGALGGIDSKFIEATFRQGCLELEPDLTLILDCEVEQSLARIQQREDATKAAASRFDKASRDAHQRIREAFCNLETAFKERVVLLDASPAPAEVVKKAVGIIEERFSLDH